MEAVAFDNKIIQGHQLFNKCGKTLDAVSKKDYPKDCYFDTSILCLDMDDYETQTNQGEKAETVDAVIGIKNHTQNRFTRQRLLLVELRMNYNSPRNLSVSKLTDKVRHTRELLGTETPIDPASWFIFTNRIIEQVKRWFRDMSHAGGDIRNFMPLSTDMFNDYVKREQDFPYKPITDLSKLQSELKKHTKSLDLQGLGERINWWHEKANDYKYHKNNCDEYCCIVNAIKEVWSELCLKLQTQTLSDDDNIYFELIDDEIRSY